MGEDDAKDASAGAGAKAAGRSGGRGRGGGKRGREEPDPDAKTVGTPFLCAVLSVRVALHTPKLLNKPVFARLFAPVKLYACYGHRDGLSSSVLIHFRFLSTLLYPLSLLLFACSSRR